MLQSAAAGSFAKADEPDPFSMLGRITAARRGAEQAGFRTIAALPAIAEDEARLSAERRIRRP